MKKLSDDDYKTIIFGLIILAIGLAWVGWICGRDWAYLHYVLQAS